MNLQKLIIEDVRCFAGRQEFNIRPLTFLVGENSTGKSTALGCLQTLSIFASSRAFGSRLDFNIEPYQMGAFADIVKRANPKKRSFVLGFEFTAGKKGERIQYLLTLTEKEKGSEPVVQEQKLIFPNSEVVFVGEKQEDEGSDEHGTSRLGFEVLDFSEKNENKFFRVKMPAPFNDMSAFEILDYADVIVRRSQESLSSMEEQFHLWLESLRNLFERRWHDPYGSDSYSFAPIRSKPQRTYNPLKEVTSPEGSDIPMVLMNMFKGPTRRRGKNSREA